MSGELESFPLKTKREILIEGFNRVASTLESIYLEVNLIHLLIATPAERREPEQLELWPKEHAE